MFHSLFKKSKQNTDDLTSDQMLTVREAATYFKVDLANFRRSLRRNTGQYPRASTQLRFVDAFISAMGTQAGEQHLRKLIQDGNISVKMEA